MTILKALLTTAIALAGALTTALGTGSTTGLGHLSTAQWLIAIGTTVGSGGIVWYVENLPGVAGGVAKAIGAAASAGIPSLVTALDDGVITQAEWLTAFVVAVTATGLAYQARNVGT